LNKRVAAAKAHQEQDARKLAEEKRRQAEESIRTVRQQTDLAGSTSGRDCFSLPTPANVVLGFLAAAANSDTVKVMSFLGDGYKADMVGECKAKEASGWTYSAAHTKITSTTADAKNSTVIVDMVFDGGGTFMTTQRTFSLLKGNGGWKIIEIQPPPTSQESGVSPL